MLTSPAAHTWACLRFPTTLTSRLSAIEDDVWCYTCVHCDTGCDRLLVLVLSKSCTIIMFGIQLVRYNVTPRVRAST